jgi:MFS family permease
VFLALGIPALFAPAAGHLADRVRRRPLLIGANALTAALVLSLLAVHSRSQLWIIYLVAFGYGVAFSVLGSGFAGLQKDLLPGPDLAAANAALTSIGYGLRIVAPLAGAALFTAFGGGAVAIMDAATFAAAIAALAVLRLTESAPEPAQPGTFRREVAAGFRHLRRVPLLAQITGVTACSFAVIGQGLHRPPSFFGIYSGVQGAGSVAAGIALTALLRRAGTARMIGLSLAWFALGATAYLSDSTVLVLAGGFADGAGVVWLVAVTGSAIQRYTPPRLQGRAQAAWTMVVVTPQTLSIAAGAALISYLSYRVMLLAIIAVLAACAAVILIRPAPEPLTDAVSPELRPAMAEHDRTG